MVDPSLAFGADPLSAAETACTGKEPLLGGALRDKAVWVDEAVCIGCRYCAHVACNTFMVEPNYGRSRVIRQDGDSSDSDAAAMPGWGGSSDDGSDDDSDHDNEEQATEQPPNNQRRKRAKV